MDKMNVDNSLRVNSYAVVSRAVEEGVAYGIRRMFKYDDGPDAEAWVMARADKIIDAVMSALCEVIDFDQRWQIRLDETAKPTREGGPEVDL